MNLLKPSLILVFVFFFAGSQPAFAEGPGLGPGLSAKWLPAKAGARLGQVMLQRVPLKNFRQMSVISVTDYQSKFKTLSYPQ